MPEEIVMPRLSDTMEEGTIAQWLKHEGDKIQKGEAIAEVVTDKANMELQAYHDGVLHSILIGDGGSATIGTVVGILLKPGEKAEEVLVQAPSTAPASPTRETAPIDAQTGPARGSPLSRENGRIKATPLARTMARAHQIDLAALGGQGSGPGGRIVKLDIERVLTQQGGAADASSTLAAGTSAAGDDTASTSNESQWVAANRIQQIMARRLLESKTTVPHFYVTSEVDMAAAVDLRARLQETFGDDGKVSYNDMIVRACALTLREMPELNRSWHNDGFTVYSHVNVGIAVGLPEGLVVPVVRDADRKGVRELSVEVKGLVDKARKGRLSAREIEGGTFTVSNLGMYDVEEFQAIINPPESAILAVGSIVEKPVVLEKEIVVRPRMRLTLSVDHRVIPGVPAAEFLQRVKTLLQEPLGLCF